LQHKLHQGCPLTGELHGIAKEPPPRISIGLEPDTRGEAPSRRANPLPVSTAPRLFVRNIKPPVLLPCRRGARPVTDLKVVVRSPHRKVRRVLPLRALLRAGAEIPPSHWSRVGIRGQKRRAGGPGEGRNQKLRRAIAGTPRSAHKRGLRCAPAPARGLVISGTSSRNGNRYQHADTHRESSSTPNTDIPGLVIPLPSLLSRVSTVCSL